MSTYYAVVIIGLCLLMGYAGQISLGHAGFFAIGGYTSAVLTTLNLQQHIDHGLVAFLDKTGCLVSSTDLYGEKLLYLSPWIAFLAAILLAVVIAFLIGVPVLRLKGHYLAMATLGFGLIIFRIVLAVPLLGEADGIVDVPPFTVLPGIQVRSDMSYTVQNFYIAWIIATLVMVLGINLINSRVGRALQSIHGNEAAANALGVNTSRYKLYTFVFSAALAALAGVFFTHYNGGIAPGQASVMKSVRYVAIVAVGGMNSLWGALFMGLLLNFLSLRGYFGTYDDAVFGIILITIMLFAPHGLLRLPQFRKLSALLTSLRPGGNKS